MLALGSGACLLVDDEDYENPMLAEASAANGTMVSSESEGETSTDGDESDTTGAGGKEMPAECQPSDYHADDFEGDALRGVWNTTGHGISVEGGELVLTSQGSATAATWQSLPAIPGLQVRAAITEAPAAPGVEFRLQVSAEDCRFAFIIGDGRIEAESHRGTHDNRVFDPDQHRWLRIRAEAGTTRFEFSADGSTWTGPTEVAPGCDSDDMLSGVRLELSAGSPDEVAVDYVEVCALAG